VLVVEAPKKSGALITANQALEQGRDVFVVPGNIDVDSFVGSNRLLRDGAIAVSSGWDVMSEYEAIYPDKIHKDEKKVHLTAYADEVRKTAESERELPKVAQKPAIPKKKKEKNLESDKKGIDNGEKPPYSDVNKDLSTLSPDEQAIAATLLQGERLVDDVIAEVGLPTAKVLATLTILEIKGVVKRLPGKRITLK
jgi:DNA processing protein